MSKPVIITTFAANDLPNVHDEAEKVWQYIQNDEKVEAVKLENTTTVALASTVLKHHKNLYFFHFGGHAEQGKIILDGFIDLDKIRLAQMLMPRQEHLLQWVFLNGCLSFGHVSTLTARGVKAVIATNVSIDDVEGAQVASLFYQCFFDEGFTLKEAFAFADTTVFGANSNPVIVEPGLFTDDDSPIKSSWTLYVNSKFMDVLNWTLEEFINKGPDATVADQNSGTINKVDVKGNNNQIIQGVSGSTINITGGSTQNADKIYNIDKIDKADFS